MKNHSNWFRMALMDSLIDWTKWKANQWMWRCNYTNYTNRSIERWNCILLTYDDSLVTEHWNGASTMCLKCAASIDIVLLYDSLLRKYWPIGTHCHVHYQIHSSEAGYFHLFMCRFCLLSSDSKYTKVMEILYNCQFPYTTSV